MIIVRTVGNDEYRDMLLELIGVEDPADALNSATIAELEKVVLDSGQDLPLVTRTTLDPNER